MHGPFADEAEPRERIAMKEATVIRGMLHAAPQGGVGFDAPSIDLRPALCALRVGRTVVRRGPICGGNSKHMLPRTESLYPSVYPNLLLHAAAADVTDGGRRPLSEGTVGRAEKEVEELRGTKFGHISMLSHLLLCFSGGSRRPRRLIRTTRLWVAPPHLPFLASCPDSDG